MKQWRCACSPWMCTACAVVDMLRYGLGMRRHWPWDDKAFSVQGRLPLRSLHITILSSGAASCAMVHQAAQWSAVLTVANLRCPTGQTAPPNGMANLTFC